MNSFIFRALVRPGFLFGLFIGPEDGGDMLLLNIVEFQQTTRRYIPEDRTLHNHRCETSHPT
jgi:hypothetical protein